MANVKPKMFAVHDGQGRMAIYLDESVGQDAILSHFAPRYQRIIVRGEPVTIFFDKHSRSFCIAPIYSKQELMNKPGRFDYITDLDWLPTARPTALAGPAGPDSPADSGGAVEQIDDDNESNEGADEEEEMEPDGRAQAATASPQSAEKIPRPPNAWILFRKEKSKQLREANPSLSAGQVSTEASVQWQAMSDEEKGFYHTMAQEAAEQHKIQYPGYRYKPGRK